MKRLMLIFSLLVGCCGCNKADDGADNVYEIGDVYYGKDKTGLVFMVTDGGRHGKIVSLDYTQKLWMDGYVDDSIFADPVFEVTGATDEDDGMNNMNTIRSIDGWREKFPAFAWCADKGKDWYLPAINELVTIYDLRLLQDFAYYYSSTESDAAYVLGLKSGGNVSKMGKEDGCKVRAVAKF